MTAPRAVPTFAIDDELKRKLQFTLIALLIYRVGAHIAAPGVNVQALADFIRNSGAAGFFGLYDTLGGGLSRATLGQMATTKPATNSTSSVITSSIPR